MILTNSMILQQPFFSKRPEALQTIDMTPTPGKLNAMIDSQMLPIKLQRLIGLEPVRVEDTPLFRTLPDLGHQSLGRDIVHYGGENPALALQHTKDLHFPSGATASNTLAFAAKVTLIAFDLTRQLPEILIKILYDLLAVLHVPAANLGIAVSQIFGRLVGRDLKTEVVQDLKIIFQFLRAVFASTSSAFEPFVSKNVKVSVATEETSGSSDSSMNNFQHCQANLRPGPENNQLPK